MNFTNPWKRFQEGIARDSGATSPFQRFALSRSLQREGPFEDTELRGNAAGAFPFTPGLTPPGKPDSLELDIPGSEWETTEKENRRPTWRKDGDEDAIAEFVDAQFKAAAEARLPLELEWALALAYREDRHWLKVASTGQKLINLQDDEQRHRYCTVPLTNAFVTKVAAMVTVAAPDVQAEGLTDSELDQIAAATANRLRAHYAQKFGRINQTKERADWALSAGTSFLKVYWDTHGKNYIPIVNPLTGERSGVIHADTGDICEEVLPPFSVYLDPVAKRFHQVRWLVHAEVKPLSYFVDRFGEEGKKVQGDCHFAPDMGYVDRYLQGDLLGVPLSPASGWNSSKKFSGAICKEYWELPSARYPRGRYIIVAGQTLLFAGDWPYEKNDCFPFIPTGYKKQAGTPYHRSLAGELWDMNLTYDRVYSQILSQSEAQVDRILIPIGAEIGADAYEDRNYSRDLHKVYYNPNQAGGPPQMQRVHGIATENLTFLDLIERKMRDVAGVHDVTQGLAPAGTPAEAVRLLQQADQTQHAQLRAELEESAQRIAEWELALATQFLPASSIVGLIDDNGVAQRGPEDPTSPVQPGVVSGQEISLDALRQGGVARMRYIPGSSFTESPDQKQQKYFAWYQAALFGPPGSPGASKMFLNISDDPRSNELVKMVEAEVAQQMQMQQEMMQQQQAMQAAQNPDPEQQLAMMGQQAQVEQEHARNLAGIEVEKKQAITELDLKKAKQQRDLKAHDAMLKDAFAQAQARRDQLVADRDTDRQDETRESERAHQDALAKMRVEEAKEKAKAAPKNEGQGKPKG